MKKKSGRIVIYILLILIAAVVLVYLVMTRNNGGIANNPAATPTLSADMVEIVVASQFIPRGTVISSNMLTTIQYPRAQLVQGTFFTSITDAVGSKAKYNIEPAVPLTSAMVLHAGAGSLAANDIPSGMTAFSLSTSPETAVAYAPQKGDHVMVVGCLLLTDLDTNYQTRLPDDTTVTIGANFGNSETGITTSMVIKPYEPGLATSRGRYELDGTTNQPVYVVPSEVQRPRLVCANIIQDAIVLQVGMFPLEGQEAQPIGPTPTPLATETAAQEATVKYPGSVTIVVSPQDNLILNYLSLAGAKLSLALKSAGDVTPFTTDPVTLQYIMDQKAIPLPAKLPFGLEPRVDTLVYPSFNDYIFTTP